MLFRDWIIMQPLCPHTCGFDGNLVCVTVFFACFLCICVWCGVDLTVATAMAVFPHNPAGVSWNGHTELNPARTNMHEWNFLPELSMFKRPLCGQMTPFTFRNRDSEQKNNLCSYLWGHFLFTLFTLSNAATTTHSFFISGIRLHSMEIQPEIGLLKLDFGRQLGSTVSNRFRPALPISNIFYLEASLYFRQHWLSLLWVLHVLYLSPLHVLSILIFFNIKFASPYLL